jgi:hypothetical protein
MSKSAGGGLFLAVAIVIGSWLLGSSFKEAKQIENAHRNSIRVKGYAQKNIESDLGKWSASIKARSTDIQSAYSQLNSAKSTTLNFLTSLGVSESSIVFSPVNTREIYQQKTSGYGETNQLEGYELSLNVSFESDNLDKIEEVSRVSSELIQQGINIQSYSPQYFYTKIEDLKLEMLAEASKNAYERAEKLAGNTGSDVGTLQSASQGVFQITSRNSTEVSDYGSFDTYSRLKTIKAVITAEFSVE